MALGPYLVPVNIMYAILYMLLWTCSVGARLLFVCNIMSELRTFVFRWSNTTWPVFLLIGHCYGCSISLPCCFLRNAIYYMSIFNTHIINSRPIFLECVILPSFFSNNCLKFNSKYFIIFKVEIVIKTVHSCKLLISWYAYFTLALTWMQCLQNKASSMQMALISV